MPSSRPLPASSLVPELASFRDDLERLGYIVVPHGDHLCVRLPQLASVRVRLREGTLDFVAQFGPFQRHHSSALTLGGASAAVVGALALTGMGPVALGAAFIGVMLAARDVGRYVVTEGCVTRLQMLWSARAGLRRGGHQTLGTPDARRTSPIGDER
ncbi:MAG: hypothetical protein ACT4PJ_00030 [Gemmatimonadaceae bacterium]